MPQAVALPAMAARFDEAARTWDDAHGPASVRAAEFAARIGYLRSLCRRYGSPRVLELGCGTGQNLINLADLIAAGVGIDIAPAMIERARANARPRPAAPLRFAIGDAGRLRDPGGPFDIVLFAGTLEHLADPDAAIDHAARVLAEDGCLIVIMPHPWSPLVRLRRLLGPADGPPSRHLSPIRLEGFASRRGLRLGAVRGLPYSPWPRLRVADGADRDGDDAAADGAGRRSGILRGAYAAEFRHGTGRTALTPTVRWPRYGRHG